MPPSAAASPEPIPPGAGMRDRGSKPHLAPPPRPLAEEVAVALAFNGATHAVMMATPDDLEDFALGFALTEGLLRPPADAPIPEVEILRHPDGIEARLWLDESAAEALRERRRATVGPVGCGLCGVESLQQAVRPARVVRGDALRLGRREVLGAHRLLRERQPLHARTRAAHAAGFLVPRRGMIAVREDVGRHNALDKLAGALLRAGVDASRGAVVLTSRVSVEMVQKTAAIGAPAILAASAPTSLAVRTAEAAGITLAASVRDGGFDLHAHPHRIHD